MCNPSPTHTYDVIVVGSGTSGIMAAIQAARRPGTSVALIDEGDYIGGQLAAAGVTIMDGGQFPPVEISGLHGEFRTLVADYYVGDPGSHHCVGNNVQGCSEPRVSRDLFQCMLDNAAPSSSGSSLCQFPNLIVSDVLKSNANTVVGVRTGIGGGAIDWHAQVVIDATEYGELIPMTGAAYRVGNRATLTEPTPDPNNNCIDDITYNAVARQYSEPCSTHPCPIPPALVMPASAHDPAREAEFHSLVTKNPYPGDCPDPKNWADHQFYRHMPDTSPTRPTTPSPSSRSRSGVNFANDYPGYWRYCSGDPPVPTYVWRDTLKERFLLDRPYRHTVLCEAKFLTLKFIHYMQHPDELASYAAWALADDEYNSPIMCPGTLPTDLWTFEALMPPIAYVRESIRIEPLDLLTGPEIEREQSSHPLVGNPTVHRAQQSVAVGDYSMDLHNCKRDADLETEDLPGGKRPEHWNGAFQIPFKTFIPLTMDGFLPAEKNLGYTRLVGGASRLQPSTMLVGQAAGAIAAEAVEHGVQPRQVRPLNVQQRLLSSGAALSLDTFEDVPKGHVRWADAQLVSTYDIMGRFTAHPPIPGHFDFVPNDSVARGYAAGALVRAFRLGSTGIPGQHFVDVPPGSLDYGEIEVMAEQGFYMSDHPCNPNPNYFCPTWAVTRPLLARWLAYARFGPTLPPPGAQLYDDVPPNHPDYLAIQAVGNEGLMFACSATTVPLFCPGTTATRGELAQSLAQVLYKYPSIWP